MDKQKYDFRILRFWTNYDRKNPDGSPRPVDMVEYCPVGMAQSRTTVATVSSLSKLQPWQPGSENEAARMAHDRWHLLEPAYKAWKEGNEIPTTGTALIAWPGLSKEQADIIKAGGLRTVEELAGATDMVLQHIRLPGMMDIREQAKRFLANFQVSAAAARQDELEKAVKSRDADLEEMKAIMLEMQRELADAKAEKKRGRPAKVLEEEAAA